MAEDFESYQSQERRRRNLFIGAALGVAGVLALPGARRGIARAVATGLEHLGKGEALAQPVRRVIASAAELHSLLERGVPDAARLAIGQAHAQNVLEALFARGGQLGAEEARGFARSIAEGAPFRTFLRENIRDFEGMLSHREIAESFNGYLDRLAVARPGVAREALRNHELSRITEQFRLERSRRGGEFLLKADETRGLSSVGRVTQALRAGAATEAERSARFGQSPIGRLLRTFGVEAVALTDPHLAQAGLSTETLAQLGRVRNQLSGLGVSSATQEGIRVEGLFRVGGRLVDVAPAGQRALGLLQAVRDNVHIPLAPGFQGISPFQLFPNFQGKLGKRFAHVASSARDPILHELLNAPGRAIGQDVFQIGDQFLAADFSRALTHPTEAAVTRLPIEGKLRHALYGYGRRRSQEVVAAMESRGGNGLLGWLGWRRQYGESQAARVASVAQKFRRDSTWAPRLFERMLTQEAGKIAPLDVRRAAHFLTSGKLSPKVERALIDRAGAQIGVAALDTDRSVLEWFGKAIKGGSDGGPIDTASNKLNQLLNAYRSSPGSVLARVDPPPNHSLFGMNLWGHAKTKRGIDLMREAIVDELEERVARTRTDGEGFAHLLAGMRTLSSGERADALGYGVGKQLLRELEGRDGAVKAAAYLRGSVEAQEAAEAFTARNTKAWHPYSEHEENFLNTAEVVSPKGAFLSTFNKHRSAGAGFLEAFWNTVRGAGGQQLTAFFTGNQKHVTDTTLALEYIPRRLNEIFSERGLGLPAEDLKSGWSVTKGLFLKRVLPAAAAVEAYRYADYKADQIGIDGPSDFVANVKSRGGRARARRFGKRLPFLGRRGLFPGLDKFLPERDEEEEIRHQEEGYEAVKKGRYWAVGSRGEFWGNQTSYFAPSSIRAARSHWQLAENVDTNSHDSWAHHWLPLPENYFLGPIKALFDRYWWEKKHAEGPNADRPYVQTGEMFDPGVTHGSLLNAALGGLLKPRRLLRPDLVPEHLGGTASREQLRALNTILKSGLDERGAGLAVGAKEPTYGHTLSSPGVLPSGMGSGGGGTGGGEAVATGGSGGGAPPAPGQARIRSVRSELAAINTSAQGGPYTEADFDRLGYRGDTRTAFHNATDLAGLYGWMVRSAVPLETDRLEIASPSRAYGSNRRFYDQELGGLGGELSELGRRFMPNQPKPDQWNPIRNRMPSWLPGAEYFVDYKHGDPYVKIPKGEMRLPGEAFERVHPVKLMETRASSLGHSVTDLMQEMLGLDSPLSREGERVTEIGKKLHAAFQDEWRKRGVLLAAEQRLYNPELGIAGHFDAVLRGPHGPFLAEIKTVGAHRFDAAQEQAFPEHVAQLNYYLHETGLSTGHLLYVDRDRPGGLKDYTIGYNDALFQETVGKVQESRRRLNALVSAGTLNRGDLYDPVTRLEILGDVAPYSTQYRAVNRYLSQQQSDEQLTDEEQRRVAGVRARVTEVKRRTTPYPYRFRGLKLEREGGTIDRVLASGRFTLAGQEGSFALAGLDLPEGSDAEAIYQSHGITSGTKVRLDRPRVVSADGSATLGRAVVLYGPEGNVNRALLRRGEAEEREDDFSDAGVTARFSRFERMKGAAWERFCLARGEEILTESGTKHVEDVQSGDRVLTEAGTWQEVIRSFERNIGMEETMLHFRTAGNNQGLRVTDNHELLAAKAVRCGQARYSPAHGDSGICNPMRTACGSCASYTPAYLRAGDLQPGDWLIAAIDRMERPDPGYSPGLYRLFGYYLAEGHVSKDGHRLCFAFHKAEREYVADVVRLVRDEFGLQAHVYPDKNCEGVTVYVTNTHVAGLFSELLGRTDSKHINPKLLSRNAPLLELVRGYLRGDGHRARDAYFVSGTLPDLIHTLRNVLLHLGVVAGLHVGETDQTRRTRYNLHITGHHLRRLCELLGEPTTALSRQCSGASFIQNGFVFYQIRTVERIEYEGSVYDLEVSGIHSYSTPFYTVHNSHLDTPFHNKFLRVRSPLEELERGIVFGKNSGNWTHPVRDFISPTVTAYWAKNPLIAAGAMGAFASFFVRERTAKLYAGAAGAAVGFLGSGLRSLHDSLAENRWKPIRTRRREELEEYWDTLEYVKHRRLAAHHESAARGQEGEDIEGLLRELGASGEARQEQIEALQNERKRLLADRKQTHRTELAQIGRALHDLYDPIGAAHLGPHGEEALKERRKAGQTLYGLDPERASLAEITAALPKYKRDLVEGFVHASDAGEQRRIYRLLPRQEQRLLGRFLGEKHTPDRPSLESYFAEHPLPGTGWEGWKPDVDLEKLRQLALTHAHLDPMESAVYPQQIEEAEREHGEIAIPSLHGQSPGVRERLHALLSGAGLTGVSVSVEMVPHDGDQDQNEIAMELRARREQEIRNALQLTS